MEINLREYNADIPSVTLTTTSCNGIRTTPPPAARYPNLKLLSIANACCKVLQNFRECFWQLEERAYKNKAGNRATPVACRWAGTVFEVTLSFGQEQ